jgi:hypothetical protein
VRSHKRKQECEPQVLLGWGCSPPCMLSRRSASAKLFLRPRCFFTLVPSRAGLCRTGNAVTIPDSIK